VVGGRVALHGGAAGLRFVAAAILRQRHGPWRRWRWPPRWWLRCASRADVDNLFGGMWGDMLAVASVAEGAWVRNEGRSYK
jgi:hypothetical protein